MAPRVRHYVTVAIRKCDILMGAATDIKRSVSAAQGRFFRSSDFADSSNYAAVRKALSRLAADEELVHIRSGLYWRGRKTRFGMTQPSVMQIVEAVVGISGVGYAGAAASNALGLSSLVPAVMDVAVPMRAPSGFGRIRFVSRAGREKRMQARLNNYEVALLEVLEGWEDSVEESYEWAVERLLVLLNDGDIRVEKLVAASDTEPAVVRARLSQFLNDAGHRDEAMTIRYPVAATRHLPIAV